MFQNLKEIVSSSGPILDCSVFPFPSSSWACQWSTMACTLKTECLVYFLLHSFIWECEHSNRIQSTLSDNLDCPHNSTLRRSNLGQSANHFRSSKLVPNLGGNINCFPSCYHTLHRKRMGAPSFVNTLTLLGNVSEKLTRWCLNYVQTHHKPRKFPLNLFFF